MLRLNGFIIEIFWSNTQLFRKDAGRSTVGDIGGMWDVWR